jgi:hypothetical protein
MGVLGNKAPCHVVDLRRGPNDTAGRDHICIPAQACCRSADGLRGLQQTIPNMVLFLLQRHVTAPPPVAGLGKASYRALQVASLKQHYAPHLDLRWSFSLTLDVVDFHCVLGFASRALAFDLRGPLPSTCEAAA